MGSACEVDKDGPSRKDVKGIGNGIVENGHSLKEKEEWGNGVGENLPNGHIAPPEPQQTDEQKEHQVRIVRWEKFLPVKTLRVLLVENDDSTRQVVSALLRKCCYEVIPAENGLHAWQCLEDLQNHIDLVLTEVAMPCLSGIGLLSKITSHKICKDIPVIRAVDFLVKPIRKNELKNLWQHVWRRCHSSSWTKRAVEKDRPREMSPDQPSDPPDSTCAQVIHPKSEICSNRWLPTANKRSGKKQKEDNDDSMGKYLEIGASGNSSAEYQSSPNKMFVDPTEKQHDTLMPQNKSKGQTMREKDSRNTQNEPTTQTVDLISSIARNTEGKQVGSAPDCSSKVPDGNDKSRDSPIDMTSEELGLKRLKTTGSATETHDERNTLKRSEISAFTRYHTTVASNQGGAGFGGSCSPQDNSSEALKTDSDGKVKSNSDDAAIKQGSNGSSNNNDMGSSTKNVITKPSSNRGKVMSPSAVKATQHTSAFHPVQRQTSPANVVGKDKADEGIANAVNVGHPGDVQHGFMQHHHHVHYYVHVMTQQQQQQPSIERGSSDAQCGSSNVFDPPIEGHAANYSMNGSISGGHNGSNGQRGASTAPNAGRPNMESANGIMDENGAGGGNGSGSGNGNDMYQNGVCYREAALNKFRQKRKVRNFGKKVRYQSRKRLAEQRPRVRGQFVRQSGQEDQAGQDEDR
uniref:CCT domain-containing protein n=1 Tax=Leersia perrieri TaxID=77586 RepID=A0A0D9VSP9_9ORYZ